MPAVAEHDVANDQQAPFVAHHFEREIDRAARALDVVHESFFSGFSNPLEGAEQPPQKPLAISYQFDKYATSCEMQAV
jgi:hypothetical protein